MTKVLVEMSEEVRTWLLKQVTGTELMWSHEEGYPSNLRLSRESLAALRAAKPAGEVWEPVGVEEIAPGVVHTSNGGDPHRMLVDENRRQVVAIPAGYALCRRRTEVAP
jgi:hypothetical protein